MQQAFLESPPTRLTLGMREGRTHAQVPVCIHSKESNRHVLSSVLILNILPVSGIYTFASFQMCLAMLVSRSSYAWFFGVKSCSAANVPPLIFSCRVPIPHLSATYRPSSLGETGCSLLGIPAPPALPPHHNGTLAFFSFHVTLPVVSRRSLNEFRTCHGDTQVTLKTSEDQQLQQKAFS